MDIKIIASSSAGNAIKISDGITSILLDAGIPIKQLRSGSGYTLSDIDGCLVTHEHQDHSKAVKDLVKIGVNIYSSIGTLASIGFNNHRFKPVKPNEVFTVGTFRIMAFDVIHDAAEPLGFLLESACTGEKLLYFSDTSYVKYTFTGITHLIIECNHDRETLLKNVHEGVIDVNLAKRIAKNHFSLERLVEFLEVNDLSKLKEVHLMHLSDNNSNEEKFKRVVQQITGTEVYVF